MPQTTCVDVNASDGFYYRDDGNLPTGAFTFHMWLKVSTWSGGNTLQDILSFKLSSSWHTATLSLDTSTGELFLTELELYDFIDDHVIGSGSSTAWLWVALMWDGSTTIQFISSAAGSSTLNKVTLDVTLANPLLAFNIFGNNNAYHVYASTAGLRNGAMSDAELLAAKVSDVQTSPTATPNAFYAFAAHGTATDDTSGNDYDLGSYFPSGSAATISDTPFTSSSHALTATSLSVTPVLATSAIAQVNALTGTNLSVTPTLGAPALAQRNLLTATNLSVTPVLATAALGNKHALTATSLSVTPLLATAALGNINALTATSLSVTPTLGSGAIAQSQALVASSFSVTPVLDTPTLDVSEAEEHELTATSLSITPVLGTSAIAQSQALVATGVSVTPVLGTAGIAQPTGLVATSLSIVPVLGTADIAQTQGLVGTSFSVTPLLGSATLAQHNALTATSLTSGVVILGTPSIESDNTHELVATGLTLDAPSVGIPTLGVNHLLLASSLTIGAPFFSEGALNIGFAPTPSDRLAVHPGETRIVVKPYELRVSSHLP